MFCSRCGQPVETTVKYCPNCGLDLTGVTQGAAATGAQPAADDAAVVRDALKDEYELEKELGRGGMAIVYKARDKALEREVAIKVLPFSLSFDAEFVERFQREARTSAKLEHPNIIPIYRVGKSGRVIYFVMKFIRGKPLSNVIEARGALPVPEIKRVLIEAGRALGYAHKHGIVHRDIKPDNIMFDELGQAIVTDFGIAKAQSGARLTGTGMSIGTPHYMSPEQARAQSLDGRSDVYSLGVVAYQCLTGHVPFDGEDSFSIGYKHIMEELPTPPLETAEQRDLFGIVQKMMAKKPEDRFQSAEDLVSALEGSGGVAAAMTADVATRPTEALRSPSLAAMASQATTPLPRASASMGKPPAVAAAEAAQTAAAKPRPPRPPRPAPKKSRAPAYVAGVLVVVIAALAGYYFLVLQKPGTAAPEPAAAAPDTTKQALAAAPPDTSKGAAPRPDSVAAAAARAESAAAKPAAPAQPAPSKHERANPRREARQETKVPPRAATAAGTPNCADASVSLRNPGGSCWDTRPELKVQPVVVVPAACTTQPGPIRVNVLVVASGDVQSAVPMDRSPCPAFQAVAIAQVQQQFTFAPAKRGDQAVNAWVQIVIRPVRR
ncbi:MAG TPA: protein kinase [Gemmatimonadales bacterium]|nr:protein kinase [Gemmatimonadales bacterium]